MARRPSPYALLQVEHAYAKARQARSYSVPGERARASMRQRFYEYLLGRRIRDVRQVREEHLVSFLAQLRTVTNRWGRPNAPGTMNDWAVLLRSLFAFAAKCRLILTSPAREIPVRDVHRLPRAVLSQTQARRLVNAPVPLSPLGLRDRAILEVLYGTAVRSGECMRLDLIDVRLTDGELMVRDGKGRKDRLVPLAGQAADAVEHYLGHGRPELAKDMGEGGLFLARSGRRLTRDGIAQVVVRYARVARIRRRVGPHALRHACATHLLQSGADIRHVQQLLGHQDLGTTALYTRVVVKDLREVLRTKHPRAGRGKRR